MKNKDFAMKIAKRVQALEAKWCAAPVILYFADGSTRELHGRHDLLVRLFRAAYARNVTTAEATHLRWIRESVGAREPGGGHLVELVRVVLAARENGPPVGESPLDLCEGVPETTVGL